MARSLFGGRLRAVRDMLTQDDLDLVEPVENGGVTSGKTVELGGSSQQTQQKAPAQQQTTSS